MDIVERSREIILEQVRKRRRNGNHDALYAVVKSETGNYYAGKPFESVPPQFHYCAERHAINQMQIEEHEDTKVDSILVAMPAPKNDLTLCTPCGACRSAIVECGHADSTVISTCFVRKEDGWNMFPNYKKYRATSLLPDKYENPWDE